MKAGGKRLFVSKPLPFAIDFLVDEWPDDNWFELETGPAWIFGCDSKGERYRSRSVSVALFRLSWWDGKGGLEWRYYAPIYIVPPPKSKYLGSSKSTKPVLFFRDHDKRGAEKAVCRYSVYRTSARGVCPMRNARFKAPPNAATSSASYAYIPVDRIVGKQSHSTKNKLAKSVLMLLHKQMSMNV